MYGSLSTLANINCPVGIIKIIRVSLWSCKSIHFDIANGKSILEILSTNCGDHRDKYPLTVMTPISPVFLPILPYTTCSEIGTL